MVKHWSILHLGPSEYEARAVASEGIRMFAMPKDCHARIVAARHEDMAVIYPNAGSGDLTSSFAVLINGPEDLDTLEIHAQMLQEAHERKVLVNEHAALQQEHH